MSIYYNKIGKDIDIPKSVSQYYHLLDRYKWTK